MTMKQRSCQDPPQRSAHRRAAAGLGWLASEPYRVFFVSGALWSVVGVTLWPLFYAGMLDFYPNLAHARLMIQSFGGGFVIGFLGTAGPRMATAPRLTLLELTVLFSLHQVCSVAHLCQRGMLGDVSFVVLLGFLVLVLGVRIGRFRADPPPPQLLLALTGVLCGIAGTILLLTPWSLESGASLRFSQLLVYQGLLLPPVLGIGAFVFPRLLGGEFGEPGSPAAARGMLLRAALTSGLLIASFAVEAYWSPVVGTWARLTVAVAYLAIEIRWRRRAGEAARGSLTAGLFWSLGLGAAGLGLAGHHATHRVSVEHLLYIGGFGMMMLVVASRVLFGHSGDLEGFFARRHWVRFLILLGVLAATTRAVPAWAPRTTVSHHIYAAVTWAALAMLWLLWHRRRFVTRDDN